MDELTVNEQHKHAIELHQKILVSANLAQQNLWDMCTSLKEMRDGKLYKEFGYSNFEDYCENEVGFNRANAHKYISIVENVNLENVSTSKHFGVSKLYLLSTISEEQQRKLVEEQDISKTTVKELEAKIKELKRNAERAEKEADLAEKEAERIEQENEKLQSTLTATNSKISVLNRKNSELQAKVTELENRPIEVAVDSTAEKRLQETIKSLERENIKRNEELEAEYQANEKAVRAMLEKDKQQALEDLRTEYEEKLKKQLNSQAPDKPDEKEVFKAYYKIAYDSFNRLFDFIKSSAEKEFFKSKTKSLIDAFSASNEAI